MSYAEIGNLSFPQISCLINRGREPETITDKSDILSWTRQVREAFE